MDKDIENMSQEDYDFMIMKGLYDYDCYKQPDDNIPDTTSMNPYFKNKITSPKFKKIEPHITVENPKTNNYSNCNAVLESQLEFEHYNQDGKPIGRPNENIPDITPLNSYFKKKIK